MNELDGIINTTGKSNSCLVFRQKIRCPDTGGKHIWCQECIFLNESTHNKKLKEIIPILLID